MYDKQNFNKDKEEYSTFDNVYTFSPSLNQGELFNSITKKRENVPAENAPAENTGDKINKKNKGKPNLIEGFSEENLGKQSGQVLNETEPTKKEVDELLQLKTQYNHIVDTYNSLMRDSLNNATNYINRSNPSTNPYIGNNLSIKNSTSNNTVTGYVTQMGVFKPYPQDNQNTYNNTVGQNNCPRVGKSLDISVGNSYNTGSYLSTVPSLLVGSVMKSGQSCGYEGQNVWVDRVISNNNDQYLNCFDETLNVTLLDGTHDFNSCKQAAIDTGYQHFALKEVNDTGIGKCAVTNDVNNLMKAPAAYYYKTIQLWSLNSNSSSGTALSYAAVGPNGSLSVANFGDNSKKDTHATPISKDQMSNYVGCYLDTPQRAIPLLNNGSNEYTYTTCMQEAQKQGKQYFGLQYLQPSGMSQCGITDDINEARKFGIANNCVAQTQNNMPVTYGGGWSNAIYSVQGYSFYFLILQDDGNMCIYRGTGPQDNQGLIWSSNTAGKQKDPNPKYASIKGKNGKNWIASPNTIEPDLNNKQSLGDFIKTLMDSVITSKDEIKWIGSTDGSIYLIMESDGNLSLNTSEKSSACMKIGENMVSKIDANAINSLFYKGYPKNIGKMGYVDENSELWEYPSSMIKPTNNYNMVSGYDYTDDSIPGQLFTNSSVDLCETRCNERNDCGGFVYENSTQNCTLKKNIPYLNSKMTPNPRTNVYKRNSKIDSPIQELNKIDSIQWENYNKSGKMMTPGSDMYNIKFANQQQLKDIGVKLEDLANTINAKTVNLEKRRLTQKQQTDLNKVSMKSLVTSYDSVNREIHKDLTGKEPTRQRERKQQQQPDTKEGFINMNRVLEESKLLINQEEMNYAIWTCLAIGIGVVLVKILQTK